MAKAATLRPPPMRCARGVRRRPSAEVASAAAAQEPVRKRAAVSLRKRPAASGNSKGGILCQRPARVEKLVCEGGSMLLHIGGPHAAEVQVDGAAVGIGGCMSRWMAQARSVLQAEGIVVLRGILPMRLVRSARDRILETLAEEGALDPKCSREEACVSLPCADGSRPLPSLLRRLDVQNLPEVRSVLEHPKLFSATAGLLQVDEVATTAYKWLRAVPPGKFTGPHMDRAYVGAGARLTAWVPFGTVTACSGGLGSLCWLPSSHTKRNVVHRYRDYQQVGADGERSGWLAADPGAFDLPVGCHWQSADFAPGDVAVFGMDLLHTTVPNETNCFRLSCDTRWQPLETQPNPVNVGPWRRQEQPDDAD